MGRLTPLGAQPVDVWTMQARCPQAHRRCKPKQRSIDVLPKPDNLIRYQNRLAYLLAGSGRDNV
jgi:hypothetical protein